MSDTRVYQQIVHGLDRLMGPDLDVGERQAGAREWMLTMHPNLGLSRPIELLEAGRANEVLELVEDLVAWDEEYRRLGL